MMTNYLNKDPGTDNRSCAKACLDRCQQVITDFGITELLGKLSYFSKTGFHTRLSIQAIKADAIETDAITTVLIEQLSTSLNPGWLDRYLHCFQPDQGDMLSDLVTLELKQLLISIALTARLEYFCDCQPASLLNIGDAPLELLRQCIGWKFLVNTNPNSNLELLRPCIGWKLLGDTNPNTDLELLRPCIGWKLLGDTNPNTDLELLRQCIGWKVLGCISLLLFDLVVRYGAGYLNTDYEVEHEGKPAPNAPYWRGKP
ncbi:MAG: hypothetical protein F6J90_07845 [Moorea sp. SIOASIH]|uniref:hypothetical protein n=1 Tax=Moorena sp. SIOASIH TaxID=2607817 RepID=UPI0013BB1223|nr:hypothetical protein [Moorena sp. SIOASIH]NEO36237.1 hypothetical protein [Moorena sp. SIOASIH]